MLRNRSYPDSKAEGLLRLDGKVMAVTRQAESHKFLGDVVWVALGQLFMSLTGLAVLPALTKSYPAELYGMWSQMVVTVGFLRILTLKFESAMIRFLAAEEDREKRRRAIGTMVWPIIAITGLILIFSSLLRQDLSLFLFADSQFVSYVPLTFLWASMEALFFFGLSYQRARREIKRFSLIRLASTVVRMCLIVGLALAGFSFYSIIVSVTIIQSLFVVGVFAILVQELGFPKFKFTGLGTYLLYSLPLMPGEVLYWVINASDRYFIAHLLGISQTGIYSASASLANLLMLLSWPIGMVLFPSVSKLWEQGDHQKVNGYFEYSMKLFLTLALPASVGLFIISQPLLRMLATAEFEVGGLLVLLLAFGVVLAGVFQINEYIFYLKKKTAWLPLINGTGSVVNIGINLALIPRIGITAAAISTIISYLVISVILAYFARKMLSYRIDFIFTLKVVVATALMSAALWFITVNSITGIILVIVIGIAVYGSALFLAGAFSKEDKKILRSALSCFRSRIRATTGENNNN